MIARLIRWSIANRFLVLLATVGLAAWGIWAVQRTPVDALPDLSDVQVLIRTTYPGPAPQIVEFERDGAGVRVEASEDATFLVLTGAPIDEPIAGYGPFVMNTREEIMTAIKDLQEGRFGQLAA